jgi:hypothetical protein
LEVIRSLQGLPRPPQSGLKASYTRSAKNASATVTVARRGEQGSARIASPSPAWTRTMQILVFLFLLVLTLIALAPIWLGG